MEKLSGGMKEGICRNRLEFIPQDIEQLPRAH